MLSNDEFSSSWAKSHQTKKMKTRNYGENNESIILTCRGGGSKHL